MQNRITFYRSGNGLDMPLNVSLLMSVVNSRYFLLNVRMRQICKLRDVVYTNQFLTRICLKKFVAIKPMYVGSIIRVEWINMGKVKFGLDNFELGWINETQVMIDRLE